MAVLEQTRQTVLHGAHLDDDGVVCYRTSAGGRAHLIYSVAQQALLGRRFVERYMEGPISVPYAEWVAPDLCPSVVDDPVARAAAEFLLHRASPIVGGGVAWLHDFDFVYTSGDEPIAAPWLSGIGQAQALLACLHWWQHSHDRRWKEMALAAIRPFNETADGKTGVAWPIGRDGAWFEEYPTAKPSHVLNCHILSLLALSHAAEMLGSAEASSAVEKGWRGLRHWLPRFDLGTWSRYDQYDRLFLLLRLVPSESGVIALAEAQLETLDGESIARLDASRDEPCDDPESRLAGIDWAGVGEFGGRPGRGLVNRQKAYEAGAPVGGTDQNTYLVFEDRIDFDRWGPSGLLLRLQLYFEGASELRIEFRDLRQENLSFVADRAVSPLRGRGWQTIELRIAPRLVGRPLPRHYHRFQTEALGTLLERRSDEDMRTVFERWHRADFFDVPSARETTSAPRSIYVFVNDRCGLKCKMCDIGIENLGIDQETLPSVLAAAPARSGGTATPVLRPALSLNMTDRARDLKPEILVNAIQGLGAESRGAMLQLNGTEPLLYPEYPTLLRAAKSAGLRTGITTSGLFLPKEAERLAEAGLDQLLLSIDGPPEVHDKIRGASKLFERILAGVESLRSNCRQRGKPEPEILVSFAVTADNHRHVLAFFEAIRPLAPSSVILNHLNFVAPEIAARHNREHPEYLIGPSSVPAWEDCQKMDFIELFRQIEVALRIDWTRVSVIPYCPTPTRLSWYYTRPELPMSRPHCAAPWASLQVRADGTVSVLARCFDMSLGDLREQSIQEVWRGPRNREFTAFVVREPYLGPCLRCCGSL